VSRGSDLDLLIRVRPQQVAKQPRVRHVRRPPDALDLLQRLELRREPAVHAQDLRPSRRVQPSESCHRDGWNRCAKRCGKWAAASGRCRVTFVPFDLIQSAPRRHSLTTRCLILSRHFYTSVSRTKFRPAHLLIYERGDGQAVEAVRERLPEPDVVPPFALIIEAVYPVDGRALMVASQEEEIFWVLHLQTT